MNTLTSLNATLLQAVYSHFYQGEREAGFFFFNLFKEAGGDVNRVYHHMYEAKLRADGGNSRFGEECFNNRILSSDSDRASAIYSYFIEKGLGLCAHNYMRPPLPFSNTLEKVYYYAYEAIGRRADGKHAFHHMYGLSSSDQEKTHALRAYLRERGFLPCETPNHVISPPVTRQWNALQWEAYAIKYCGDQNLAGGEHLNSYGTELSVNGRASIFRDEKNKIFTISFRGSSNLENYLNDVWCGCIDISRLTNGSFKALPEKYKTLEVRRGFSYEYAALQKLFREKNIYQEILNKQNAGWRLLITGHSLGGALAVCTVADLLLNFSTIQLDKTCLVTFGAPRLGNKVFSQWIDRSGLYMNLRIEVEGDPVVSLPAQNDGAYFHTGSLSLIRKTPRGFERVYAAENPGEANEDLGAVGNLAVKVIRTCYDGIDPSLSRIATSASNALAWLTLAAIRWENPYKTACLHGRYWDCLQYIDK